MRAHEQAMERLALLKPATTGTKRPICPPDDVWLEIAAGIARHDPEDHVKHAAECDHCGPLLRRASLDLSEPLSTQERKALMNLQSNEREWQRALVQKMVGLPPAADLGVAPAKRLWREVLLRYWPVWSAGFATLVGIAIWFGSQRAPTSDANQLLAAAYTDNRVIELRIVGAQYAPLKAERSSGGSSVDQPLALLDANALISRHLRSNPEDPKWLQAKARSDLLEFHYDSAIQTLQRVLDLRPDSTAAMIDLATAYYERALANSDREVDYGRAVDYLGRVLAKAPDDPLALFNRAICLEKLHLYSPAIIDWQRYLRIDSTSSWAEEARQRLVGVQTKVSKKQSSLRNPLWTTAQLASNRATLALSDELDSRVEDYLRVALEEWLPSLFLQTTSSEELRQANDARVASAALAAVTKGRHGDAWMEDLLKASERERDESGLVEMSAAIQANERGDYEEGLLSAHKAARSFQLSDNLAGRLRAQAEEVYSYHLLYDGRKCMALLRSMNPALQNSEYEWLKAQMSLEESNCATLLGDLGAAAIAINSGTIRAAEYKYSDLFLRGVGFEADYAASLGDVKRGFSLATSGLDRFWSSNVDLMKGYNLYTDLDTAADVMRLPHLQVELWRQATDLIDLHPDLVQRAMAHRWLGNSAYLAEMPDLAAQEFGRASTLFSRARPTEATARGQMDADIWLAGLETRRGDFEQATIALQQVKQSLESAPSFTLEIGFYSTQAELRLRRKDWAGTESSLRSAIFLAEWALGSFPSDADRAQWAKQTTQAYRDLIAWKLALGEELDALELWAWYRGSDLRVPKPNAATPSDSLGLAVPPDPRNAPPIHVPTVIRDSLPSLRGETVVTYIMFSEGIAVWVYDDRGIFSRWISVKSAEIEDRALRFHRLCSTRDSNMGILRSTGGSLYDFLIAPIEDRLTPERTLVFEAEGVLSEIPMEALIDHKGRYLAERYRMTAAVGFYQSLRLRPAIAITSQTPALIVSVPVAPGVGIAPLTDAESEALTVGSCFRSARRLSGRNASLAAIRVELPGAVVFHFVGHAAALPELNGLLLADYDNRAQHARLLDAESLSPKAIRNLQLAVLSACDTGALVDGTSGTEGLVQALLRNGVPHVVASRWRVDSAQTALLMRAFYQRLLAGNDVATSLHAAELELVSHPGSSHPYYWAAFELEGL